MRAPPGDCDVEEGAARHHYTRPNGELPHFQARPVMHAVDKGAGETREQPVLDHRLGAAQALLGGLEDEIHRAVEIAGLREVARRAQQHRGMAVMAAGVHAARRLAAMGEIIGLVHRQAVHVGAQADRDLAIAPPEHANHAGAADVAMHLDAPFGELRCNDVGGAPLLEADLGMGVNVAADRREFVMEAANGFEIGHGPVPVCWPVLAQSEAECTPSMDGDMPERAESSPGTRWNMACAAADICAGSRDEPAHWRL